MIKQLKHIEYLNNINKTLKARGFNVIQTDFNRPWGGFFVIDESQSEKFMNLYFPNESIEELTKGGRVCPKILVVSPNKRLSWQYHYRRSEVWRVIDGKVGVIKSDTDVEGDLIELNVGDKITLAQGERHRLVGLDEYGIIAEIWQHMDAANPSNEEDIVRLQDDFNRQ